MTEEELKFEFEQAETFMGRGNRKSGKIVLTKSGVEGRIYNFDSPVNGKVKVYTTKGKLLCNPETLTVKGFFD